MKLFFTILMFLVLVNPCFAEEKPKQKKSENIFKVLGKFISENEVKVAEEGEELDYITINKKNLVSKPFSEFSEDMQNFSNGGFISVKEYEENTIERLDYAYRAMVAGHTEVAIKTYREILDEEPENKYAMFGLATAYHHNKESKKAIEAYKKVLKKYPDYNDAFNNLMVLLSNEYPSKGLLELKKLEAKHPSFAPIPAQIGVIYHKTNNSKEAIRYLTKALRLEPNNVMYRYNLAVAYDKIGDAKSAGALYKQLLIAHEKGNRIPISEDEILDRLAAMN